MDDYVDYIGNLLVFLSVIIPLFYLIGFTKFGKTYQIFTVYLTFIAIIQLLLSYYAALDEENIFLFHYYFIGQFFFLSLFYYNLLKYKWIIFATIIVSILLGYSYYQDPAIYYKYHTSGALLTHSIIVIYALIYYYHSLTKDSNFLYINSGVLIYFLTSVLFYASGNLILKLELPKETQRYLGRINDAMYFIFIVFMFIEWFKNYRTKSNLKI